MELSLDVSPAALAELAKVGFDPVFGARPLKRAIQQRIENPLSKLLLEGRFPPKSAIAVGVDPVLEPGVERLGRRHEQYALLLRAEEAGLLPAGVGQQAGDAYRHWRKVQHRARLDEQPVELPDAVAEPHRQAGLTLWRHVFGGGA